MTMLINEEATLVSNEPVGPSLNLMTLAMPAIASAIKPGQFVHLKVPGAPDHILRRPFSVYDAHSAEGTIDILYQEVGSLTTFMAEIESGIFEAIGPVGHGWTAPSLAKEEKLKSALLVGGGVGAAPLFLLAKELSRLNVEIDVVLGAQTKDAHVCASSYESVGCASLGLSTDDGTLGTPGFCTILAEERLKDGTKSSGAAYDYVAVCGPEPLMKAVANLSQEAGVYCEVSMERPMACGMGACLSCVVDTKAGKKRSCVDGPVFPSSEVLW